MNLLADESVDRQIVERLRQDGHDILYVAEVEPSISDMVIFAHVNSTVVSLRVFANAVYLIKLYL